MTDKQIKNEMNCEDIIRATKNYIERLSFVNPMIYTSKNEEFVKELNVLRRKVDQKISNMVVYKDNGLPPTDPRFRSYLP